MANIPGHTASLLTQALADIGVIGDALAVPNIVDHTAAVVGAALVLVFNILPWHDLHCNVPLVCRSFYTAASVAYGSRPLIRNSFQVHVSKQQQGRNIQLGSVVSLVCKLLAGRGRLGAINWLCA